MAQAAMASFGEKISGSFDNLPSMNVGKTVFGPKSLTDMIRGIRSHKKNEASYISECLQEIKMELKTEEHDMKSAAVQKLTYLHLLGYDISWAAFNIIEVMSQPTFTNKRIGYLAASQSFHEGTEVVMLATSLLKKAFNNTTNQYESGAALNVLANICTPDLARDLASDVVTMMNSSRPYIKKKAVLVLYKVFLKFPEALRPSFPRLKDKLEDPDPSVVSAAVNVICELSRKNPKNYLPLAPLLFKILQSSQNNWMLIKLVKLFAALMPLDKRLGKRMTVPLTNFINSTTSMSLLYECIQTCIMGLSHRLPVIKLCISKLRIFIEDPDQNLKYLGLLALYNIMKTHPKAVGEHRDLVIKCLDDPDVTIRLRALDLLSGMVTKKNIREIVKRLLESINNADGYYRNDLIEKTIYLCSQESYKFITDFEWYLSILMQLTRVANNKRGALLAEQFMDVIIRVEAVRHYGVNCMAQLLRDAPLFESPEDTQEVLYAAVYLVGEFAKYAANHVELMVSLLQPRVISLPAHVQAVYMQNVLKLFAYVSHTAVHGEEKLEDEDDVPRAKIDESTLNRVIEIMQQRLPLFKQSAYLEVQERACFAMELLNLYVELKNGGQDLTSEFASIFAQPLNPVAPGANKRVPVPKGLDLDKQINEIPVTESDSEEEPKWWQQKEDEESYSEEEGGWGEAVLAGRKSEERDRKKDKKGKKDKRRKGREGREERDSKPKERKPYSPYVLSTGDTNSKLDHEKEQRLRGEITEHSPRSGEQGEDDEPPIVDISGTFSRKVKERSERRPKKPKVKAVVQTGFDMPDAGEETPVAAAKGGEGGAIVGGDKTGLYADTDLFHVDPSLSLPVPQHRSTLISQPAQPVQTAAATPDKGGKKERHGHKGSRKHRHGDKDDKNLSREEKKKRHEERKKRHEERKKGGGQLVDIGEPSTSARGGSGGGASSASAFFSLDEAVGGGGPGAPGVAASPLMTPSPASPPLGAATVIPIASPPPVKEREHREHRKRRDKEGGGGGGGDRRKTSEKGEKKERRRREGEGGAGDKKHSRHHHHSSSQKKEKERARPPSGASPSPGGSGGGRKDNYYL